MEKFEHESIEEPAAKKARLMTMGAWASNEGCGWTSKYLDIQFQGHALFLLLELALDLPPCLDVISFLQPVYDADPSVLLADNSWWHNWFEPRILGREMAGDNTAVRTLKLLLDLSPEIATQKVLAERYYTAALPRSK
mmetsp:Transcript_21778/g.32430  ORF Transcript_21778/g.32430 Transcript_21778/m.32430 type:complete len:138 (-) Transcript_21778:923-1336(-)